MGGLRTGVLGGTFDPPHLAHLVLAAAARHALALERVLFVPAGEPWRKAERAVTAAEARVRMVRAAVAPLPWAAVSTIEVERRGPSYSAETLAMLAADGGDWWFLLGADALRDLPQWREPQRLLAVARLGLAQRPDGGAADAVAAAASIPGLAERVDAVPMPELRLSATELRERLRRGRPVDVLVPRAVQAVIAELGLYRDAG